MQRSIEKVFSGDFSVQTLLFFLITFNVILLPFHSHVSLPRLVNVQVHLQLHARVKASAARCAAMGLFAIFGQLAPAVLGVVAADEAQATLGAQVGPLSSVPPHVNDEAGALGERLAAELTGKGFSAGVNPHVQDEVGPPLEPLAALQALKALLLVLR